jgi:hypothetical protein
MAMNRARKITNKRKIKHGKRPASIMGQGTNITGLPTEENLARDIESQKHRIGMVRGGNRVVLGPELLDNSDFQLDPWYTDWNFNGNWDQANSGAGSGNGAIKTTSTGTLNQQNFNFFLLVGVNYRVTFTVHAGTWSVYQNSGNTDLIAANNGVGDYSFDFTCNNNNTHLSFLSSSENPCELRTVSLKVVILDEWAP